MECRTVPPFVSRLFLFVSVCSRLFPSPVVFPFSVNPPAMKELHVVLPSQSLDSLTLDYTSDEGNELLMAWSVAYHPAILHLTQQLANPYYGLYVYDEPFDKVFLLPAPSRDVLEDAWIERAKQRGCVFLTDFSDLDKLVQDVLEAMQTKTMEELRAEEMAQAKPAPSEPVQSEPAQSEQTQLESSQSEPAQSEQVQSTSEGTTEEPLSEESPKAETVTEDVAEPETATEGEPTAETEAPAEPATTTKAEQPTAPASIPTDDDFIALGMTHLLSELLSHKQHYTSYLDSFGLKKNVLLALECRDKGDENQARFHFQSAWDQMIQSRQYYAPADGYCFDLVMLTEARSQLSELALESLQAEGANVLLDGKTAERIASEFPEVRDALRAGVEANTLSLIGGEYIETELPLLTPEGIQRRIAQGLKRCEAALGCRPSIFGRRCFGLTPMLPGILKQLGFSNALHSTMDEGVFPVRNQSRILWKGLDGSSVEAIAKIPANAQDTREICDLPTTTAKALNVDNAFGTLFAHWGVKKTGTGVSLWYHYLKLAARWVPMFGTFSTMTKCFDETKYSSSDVRFRPDEYQSPYLLQAMRSDEPNPISRWCSYHQTRVRLEALANLQAMYGWVQSKKDAVSSDEVTEDWLDQLDSSEPLTSEFFASCKVKTREARKQTVEALSKRLSDGTGKRANAQLWLNPWSFTVRAGKQEIPPLGFVSVPTEEPGTKPASEPSSKWGWFFSKKSTPEPEPIRFDKASSTWVMTNSQLELRFDTFTGHLRAVYDHYHRGNRLSQQLAMRTAASPIDSLDDEDSEFYSIQAADEIRPEIHDGLLELHVSGRLMNRQGKLLSHFTQITTLYPNDSVIGLDIYLDPVQLPVKNPWQSYYANRLVWSDSTSDVFRSVGFGTVETQARKIEAPYFVDVRPLKINTMTRVVSSTTQALAERVRGEKLRKEAFLPERDEDTEYDASAKITLLSCGLPYHRRVGMRKLDSLLLVHGETCRRFRLGIALNKPYAAQSALAFMQPPISVGACRKEESLRTSAWFGHVGHRNVILTHVQPTSDENGRPGAILRFAETEGRKASTSFQSVHDIQRAEQTDFYGQNTQALHVENGAVQFTIPAFGFIEIRVYF